MVAGIKKSFILALGTGFLLLAGISNSAQAQQRASFKVGGPCMSCGAGHVEGLTKAIDGVKSAAYDAGKGTLTVDFDPVNASLIDIQLELSLAGYDAGDFKADGKAKLPPCAGMAMRGEQANAGDLDEPGIDDMDLEEDGDWEDPTAFDALLDDDIDLPLDEEDDDDIDLLGTDDTPDPADGDDDDDDDDNDR